MIIHEQKATAARLETDGVVHAFPNLVVCESPADTWPLRQPLPHCPRVGDLEYELVPPSHEKIHFVHVSHLRGRLGAVSRLHRAALPLVPWSGSRALRFWDKPKKKRELLVGIEPTIF